jgi:hypothetical protein
MSPSLLQQKPLLAEETAFRFNGRPFLFNEGSPVSKYCMTAQ